MDYLERRRIDMEAAKVQPSDPYSYAKRLGLETGTTFKKNIWTYHRFTFNGVAIWVSSTVYTVSCSVNIRYYPFDTQICFLHFSVNAYTSWEVLLNPSIDEQNEKGFTENGEWDLIKTEIIQRTRSYVSSFKVKLVLTRRPIFVVVNMIIPIIFLSVLNTMVFSLPVESGELIYFNTTTVLALAVFLTIIGDNIPKTSAPFLVICFFIGAQVTLNLYSGYS